MNETQSMIDTDDRDGQTCTKCGAGHYTETSIHDDWDGLLHCTNKNCNHEVKRYKSEDEPKPKPEPQEVFVSSKTQAAIDAYEATADKYKALAAVIRAVADQVVPETKGPRNQLEYELGDWDARDDVRDKLLAIVTELNTL
jgi:hypothetical protein